MRLKRKQFEKQWQKIFSEAAQKGGKDCEISCWTKQGLRTYFMYFSEYFLSGRGKNNKTALLLDIGCGPGTFSRLLDAQGFQVFGVDYSEEMIKAAKIKSKNSRINYKTADADNLPFADNFFDIIICLGLFQHIEEPVKVLQEIRRVLKKDGLAVITTLNRFSLAFLLGEKKKSFFLQRYNPYNFKKIFGAQGFYKIKLKGIYFTPFVFLTNIILRFKIYKFLNLFFPFFLWLSHSFHLEGRKK